jgi:hypothetical protein
MKHFDAIASIPTGRYSSLAPRWHPFDGNASTETAKRFGRPADASNQGSNNRSNRHGWDNSTIFEGSHWQRLDVVVRLTQVIERLKAEREDADLKPTVIGTWGFSNKADGHTAVIELNADQSYTVGGKQIGRWQIREKQIIITYVEGGHQDRYSLPVKEEKLTGTNDAASSDA